jgi:hypothetical protein
VSAESWWDAGGYSPAARYFRGLIDISECNECNLCNGEKFAALRLLLEVRSMWWEATKTEVLQLAFDRVLEDPSWRPRPRDTLA